ncbi:MULTISPECIES: urease accessory protein UreD [unclassified Haloferax]|uniref:urease accessory protein UreD n=1 Tax=unclassified Haloferax TaxID=2625095 RepID=UPI0002B205D1|nr:MULTISPECIES: urease accessory protein UreD [unclassified Haloferax]ELZ61165.1 urease accessory protein UreD [Haloferax sp. ATCC BAA-645]ELZ61760.1 urease accessory protein UreD [Haloferax sp. ATCC BAA-646]ELZ71516.1 urease accessory protein UreD [Haloferax sp. ATCC BAA-644]
MAADAPHPAFEGYAAETVPQAAVGSPGKDGVLALTFDSEAGGTKLVYDYATVPFHVSGTLAHDPHPDAETVFVQSPTGGVAQGDRHDIDIEARPGTVAHVSTQSSTKVQSMTRNYAAADVSLSVAGGAHLDYVPEPTILHEGSRYLQQFRVTLDAGATAVVGDIVVPGRLARGERFAFERYLSQIRVHGSDGLLFADATHLTPGEEDPTTPGVLGEFTVYGTLFVIAPDRDAAALSDELHAVVADETLEARSGATELPNGAGVTVRSLGERAETVKAALQAAWDRARRELVGAPAPEGRKY